MLAQARQAADGLVAVDGVRPLLFEIVAGAQQMHLQFCWNAEGNPEMTPALVASMKAALQQYLDALGTLDGALASGSQIVAAVDKVEAARQRVHAAQRDHEAHLVGLGPTSFLYLNRVLVQLEYLAGGGTEVRFAKATLTDLAEFLSRLEQDVGALQRVSGARSDEAQRALRDLRREAEALRETVERGGRPAAAARHRLLDAAERLQTAMAGSVEATLSGGPTELLAVNLVLQAADGFVNGSVPCEGFVDAVRKCRDGLGAQASPRPEVQPLMDAVASSLSRMEAAAQSGNRAAVTEEAPTLTNAAQSLTWYASMAATPEWDDEDTLLDFVMGENAPAMRQAPVLPRSLQNVIEVASGFVNGQADRDTLLEAVDRLERIAARFQGEAARLPRREASLNFVQEGLELLAEAAESLRALAATGDRRAVEAARALMTQAVELFTSVRG